MQAVDDSLKRLQTDVIDLYQSHKDDAETPLEETLGAFGDLIRPARCAPSVPPTTPRRGCRRRSVPREARPAALRTLQPHYNLWSARGTRTSSARSAAGGARRHPLLRAGLRLPVRQVSVGGDFAKSPRGGGMAKYLTPRGHAVLGALDAVAAEVSATPAQVAMAAAAGQAGHLGADRQRDNGRADRRPGEGGVSAGGGGGEAGRGERLSHCGGAAPANYRGQYLAP